MGRVHPTDDSFSNHKENPVSTTTQELLVTFVIPVDVIEHMKSSNGLRYWTEEEDAELSEDIDGDLVIKFNNSEYTLDNRTAVRGIKRWVSVEGGNLGALLALDTDHTDHDVIWQLGFFGEVVYG